MRLTKRQLLTLIYEQQVADSKTPEEVEPEEGVWGTGEALEDPVDYEKEVEIPSNVQEPEVLEIVEKLKLRMQLRKIVNENIHKR